MNLTGFMKALTFSGFCLLFSGTAAQAQVTGISDDFSDGDYEFWTVDNPDSWEVVDGVLQQKQAVSTSENWLSYFARLDSFQVDGDFTLTVDLGFNPSAYPMAEDSVIHGDIFYRSYAFGIVGDSNSALLTTFRRSSGSDNGVLKITGGVETMLYSPYSGQGMGLELHNIRRMKMSRRGRIITVHVDGRVVYQTEESPSSGQLTSGSAVVCSRGPVGLALDRLELMTSAPPPPTWLGPQEMTDFFFFLAEGSGHLITSDDFMCRGTVEVGGTEPGSFFGWWVEEDHWSLALASGQLSNEHLSMGPQNNFESRNVVVEGNWSWAAAGGQLSILGYTMGPQATLEGWFKFLNPGPDYGVPIFHLMFDGSLIDPAWGRERGGPVLISKHGDTKLRFHEFGGVTADIMGDIGLGEWHHIAWVRDGIVHTFYIDAEEAGSVEIPRYGETTLTGIQINVANNADHDWLRGLGSPYLYVDAISATSIVLNPRYFVLVGPSDPPPERPCDINQDGKKNITDVIALLLLARRNPNIRLLDQNRDGTWSVADAIELILRIKNGACPDS